MLGALLSCCAPGERILLIEDAPELVVAHDHVVRLLCRTANVENAGAVGPAELVRQALRMRPDRVVVGEFRGAEFAELLAALNTGHDGGAATIHANAVADVPARFAALGAMAGLPTSAVQAQVASAFNVVIQLRRGGDGVRRIHEIAVLDRTGPPGSERAAYVLATVWNRLGVGAGAAILRRLLIERDVRLPRLLQ